MNSSVLIELIICIENCTTTLIRRWYIPCDILMIICTMLVVFLAGLFLLIIILDKTCHTVSMMLTANSCLAILVSGSNLLYMSIFTLQNDLQEIEYEDLFCRFRGYISYASGAAVNYSFFLQSIYRYIRVVYPSSLFWQSTQTQILLIILTWIFTLVYPLAFLFTNDIIYDIHNQICQVPLGFSFPMIYITLCLFTIPISMIMIIYLKLVRYVKQMRKRVTSVITLFHAKRELKVVQRTVLLVMILFTIGFPYALFVFMSFVTILPQYHFRIAYLSLDTSALSIIIALFRFTKPLKVSIMKILKRRSNR